MMMTQVFNSLEKLRSPPLFTTPVPSPQTQSVIFKSWSTLWKKVNTGELSSLLKSETELLAGFIMRKGTQLRLEKALMLSNRIHKLGRRWSANNWLHEFTKFDDGVQLSLHKKSMDTGKQVTTDEGKQEKAVRLPSRQWANWIMYLTLRDCLILAKIKYECERTVKYWLGLISSSHHATDSLVAVGILSRIWYVSSSIVEGLITVSYPTVCKLSIHLEPTEAENWLTDLEMPSPEDLNSWLTAILGYPFIPARLSKGLNTISQGTVTQPKLESVIQQSDSKFIKKTKSTPGNLHAASVASIIKSSQQLPESSEDEDLGVPVPSSSKSAKKPKKKQIVLNEKWVQFFSAHKSKLKTEKGKKQFCVRIKKYLSSEDNKSIVTRLKKLRKCIKTSSYKDIIVMINQFQKFLSKQISL